VRVWRWSNSCDMKSIPMLEECFMAEGSVPFIFLVGVTARLEACIALAPSPLLGAEYKPLPLSPVINPCVAQHECHSDALIQQELFR
jgi:hypothetical protein